MKVKGILRKGRLNWITKQSIAKESVNMLINMGIGNGLTNINNLLISIY